MRKLLTVIAILMALQTWANPVDDLLERIDKGASAKFKIEKGFYFHYKNNKYLFLHFYHLSNHLHIYHHYSNNKFLSLLFYHFSIHLHIYYPH